MSSRRPTDAQVKAYAESLVLTGNQSEAFRAAFPKSKASAKAQAIEGCKFRKLPNVRLAVQALQEEVKAAAATPSKKFSISFEEKQKYLVSIMVDAKKSGKHGPGVSACKLLCEMDGDLAVVRHAIGGDDEAAPVRLSLGDFYNAEEVEAAKRGG